MLFLFFLVGTLLFSGFSVFVYGEEMAIDDVDYRNSFDGGFGIYALASNQLILSNAHIISYHKSTHEIVLNEEGIRRWEEYMNLKKYPVRPSKSLGGLYGKSFVVKLYGKEVYRGAFWSMFSNESYEGIVILDTMVIYDRIRIDLGHKNEELQLDIRDNTDIYEFFERQGKLIS